MNLWLKNSDGKKDAVLTMAVFSLVVVLLKALVGGITVELAGKEIGLGSIDAALAAALLTPTLGAYVSRRYTDRKYHKAAEAEKKP